MRTTDRNPVSSGRVPGLPVLEIVPTFRVLIAAGEAATRAQLQRFLTTQRDMTVVESCANGRAARYAIQRHRPDLLFLQARLHEMDGFRLFESLDLPSRPLAVFVSDSEMYAARAFAVDALDYLTTPFDHARLRAALERARARLSLAASAESAPIIAATATDTSAPRRSKYLDRIPVRTGVRQRYQRTSEIDRIEADGNYVQLHVGGKTSLVRATMTQLERALDPARFARVHRSTIVNLDRVVEVEPFFGHDFVIRLVSGERVRMSRSYHGQFERRMQLGV